MQVLYRNDHELSLFTQMAGAARAGCFSHQIRIFSTSPGTPCSLSLYSRTSGTKFPIL